jgi:hypothetical protein
VRNGRREPVKRQKNRRRHEIEEDNKVKKIVK